MKLYSLGLWCPGAWVIGRNFNVIRSRGRRLGFFYLRNMAAFNDWIDFFDLLDYPDINKKYS
jgi:hypothetical protein